MLTFNITLEPATLYDLTKQLTPLVTDIQYNQRDGVLSIASSDEANEPRIVDIVASVTRTADLPPPDEPYIDWLELARKAQREKRQAAALEKADMARIRAKRARQAMAVKI